MRARRRQPRTTKTATTTSWRIEAAPARAPTSGEHLREGETWDPYNPLNARGPHRHAPPDRIDHVFLKSGTALDAWRVEKAETMFQAPIVPTSEGNVTISDHYGLVVSLRWQAPARASFGRPGPAGLEGSAGWLGFVFSLVELPN